MGSLLIQIPCKLIEVLLRLIMAFSEKTVGAGIENEKGSACFSLRKITIGLKTSRRRLLSTSCHYHIEETPCCLHCRHNPARVRKWSFRSSVLMLCFWGVFNSCNLVRPVLGDDQCSQPGLDFSWNPSAQVRFGLALSLRKSDRLGCGMVSPEVLQLYVATQWVAEKLNNNTGNGSFIPGVTFGFDVLDDCRSSSRAVQFALDYTEIYSTCQPASNSSEKLIIGLIGPSRSNTAEAIADAMRTIPVPIISSAATLATLTGGGMVDHPNFFRTIPSDKVQIKLIVSILTKLKWTYVTVVHTNDNYGTEGANALKEMALEYRICVASVYRIDSDIVSSIAQTRLKALGQSLAVVYIGEKDKAENLLFTLRNLMAVGKQGSLGLHFIMSDSVSSNIEIFESSDTYAGPNIALGTLALTPSNVILQEFEDYMNKKYSDVLAGSVKDDIIKSSVKAPLQRTKQTAFVPLHVNAIFALAEALRRAHALKCGVNTSGVCQALVQATHQGIVLDQIKLADFQVNFTDISEYVAPREFKSTNYVLEFDSNGDIVPKPQFPDYTINAYNESRGKKELVEIGRYRGGNLELDMTNVRMVTATGEVSSTVLPSVCAGSCQSCADMDKIPMVHLNGSAYIVGIFSLHEAKSDNPFVCGNFRNISDDAIAVEAFINSVLQLRQSTNIDFGAIAFDDCYSPLRITSILTDYFSGLSPVDLSLFNVTVPVSKIVGVVGAMSSGASITAAKVFTPLRVPVVSYGSSSPDLDDIVNYPYFLRTVPSDEEQATAMVEVLYDMGWEYVGLLYVANNYGSKGAQAVQRAAVKKGICLADPVSITESPTGVDEKELNDAFQKLLLQNVKVVVFFGPDIRMSDFLRLMESRGNQGHMIFVGCEDWATKISLLDAGKGVTKGSITFKFDNIESENEPSLRTRLLERKPSENDVNPWFSDFWQYQFRCNIPGGFNNIFDQACSPNLALSTSDVTSMLSDQRVKHVMNAVQALGEGLVLARTQICENKIPCAFLQNEKYVSQVVDMINMQTVKVKSTDTRIFDENRNGNVGYIIYNIQSRDGNLLYVPVGTYNRQNGLTLDKKNLVFYSETGLTLSTVDASCSNQLCAKCAALVDPSATPSPSKDEDQTFVRFRLPDMITLIVLFAVCLIVICIIIYCFSNLRHKIKELREQKTNPPEPIYQHIQDRRVYTNVEIERALLPVMATSRSHIRFVNSLPNSTTPSPANTLDGHINPAFVRELNSPTSVDPMERNAQQKDLPTPEVPARFSSRQVTSHQDVDPSSPPIAQTNRHHSAAGRLPSVTSQASNVSTSYNYINPANEDDLSGEGSRQRPKYGTTSFSPSRELPAFPRSSSSVSGSSRPRSLPVNSQKHEQIPLRELSYGERPYFPSSYHHRVQENPNTINYSHMTQSGQLVEGNEMQGDTEEDDTEDDVESAVEAYTLSSRQTVSPLRSQTSNPSSSDQRYLSDQSAGLPGPMSMGSNLNSLEITPELRDKLLLQLLIDNHLSRQLVPAGSYLQAPVSTSLASQSSQIQDQDQNYSQTTFYPSQNSNVPAFSLLFQNQSLPSADSESLVYTQQQPDNSSSRFSSRRNSSRRSWGASHLSESSQQSSQDVESGSGQATGSSGQISRVSPESYQQSSDSAEEDFFRQQQQAKLSGQHQNEITNRDRHRDMHVQGEINPHEQQILSKFGLPLNASRV